jgi:hypothetical protein
MSSNSKRGGIKTLTEHQIQSQILEWLKLKRYLHWRENSGGMRKGKHWIAFGGKGHPDIWVVRPKLRGYPEGYAETYCELTGIEVKDAKGEQSRAQKEFQTQLEASGGRYLLVRSLQDAIDALR